MTTLNTMVKRVDGLRGTGELTKWEEDFIASVLRRTNNGDDTRTLGEKEITILERLHEKHFAG